MSQYLRLFINFNSQLQIFVSICTADRSWTDMQYVQHTAHCSLCEHEKAFWVKIVLIYCADKIKTNLPSCYWNLSLLLFPVVSITTTERIKFRLQYTSFRCYIILISQHFIKIYQHTCHGCWRKWLIEQIDLIKVKNFFWKAWCWWYWKTSFKWQCWLVNWYDYYFLWHWFKNFLGYCDR